MSLQEIERAITELPERQQAELRDWINQRAGQADALVSAERGDTSPWDPGAVKREGRATDDLDALAAAAGEHWQGGDGLEYQLRIRAEWDDRPTLDR